MNVNAVQGGAVALSLLRARAGADGAAAMVAGSSDPRDPGKLLASAAAERKAAEAAQAESPAKAERHAARPGEQHRSGPHRHGGDVARIKARMQGWLQALKRLAGPDGLAGLTGAAGSGKADLSVVSLVGTRGADAVAIRADLVLGVATRAGSDAVTIDADVVMGVITDLLHRYDTGPDDVPNGDPDAVAISARLVGAVYTGGGNDAVAIRADRVADVYGGDGQDAIGISAGMVSNIYGGDGADAIALDAAFGMAASAQLGGLADWQLALAGDAAGRFTLALNNIADVDGGGGDDAIAISGAQLISVDGGMGDDLISLSGQTVAVRFGRDGGHDVVQLAAGTEVVLQLDPNAGDYTVTTDGDRMVVDMGDAGSVTFVGVAAAGAIGITKGWQPVELLHGGSQRQSDAGLSDAGSAQAALPEVGLNRLV